MDWRIEGGIGNFQLRWTMYLCKQPSFLHPRCQICLVSFVIFCGNQRNKKSIWDCCNSNIVWVHGDMWRHMGWQPSSVHQVAASSKGYTRHIILRGHWCVLVIIQIWQNEENQTWHLELLSMEEKVATVVLASRGIPQMLHHPLFNDVFHRQLEQKNYIIRPNITYMVLVKKNYL